jgi:hypothetical protein
VCVCVCAQVYAPATGHVASFSITLSKINKLRAVLAEHAQPQVRRSLAAKRHVWFVDAAGTETLTNPNALPSPQCSLACPVKPPEMQPWWRLGYRPEIKLRRR